MLMSKLFVACIDVQRLMQAKQMLDRLRACIVASYYGRVMHSAQPVRCFPCISGHSVRLCHC